MTTRHRRRKPALTPQVKKLLAAGANPNYQFSYDDGRGPYSLIHLATLNGISEQDFYTTMQEAGADLSSKDYKGRTPLVLIDSRIEALKKEDAERERNVLSRDGNAHEIRQLERAVQALSSVLKLPAPPAPFPLTAGATPASAPSEQAEAKAQTETAGQTI